ncbi:MAG: hypothetical protein WCA29_08250 [Jiangellales bacterium]
MSAEQAGLLATAAHLGFQGIVTVVVCPALLDLAPLDWARGHAAHIQRIIIVVVLVYAGMGLALGWALATACCSRALLVATTATLVVWVTTGLAAAPTHQRLKVDGPTPTLVRRLRRADAVRLAAAAVACGAALFV